MYKRIGYGLLIVLIAIITIGYIFRMPLTQWFLAPKLAQAGVQLQCLDWSIDTELNLNVTRACFDYQGQQLELTDIVADSKVINVARANLYLTSTESASKSESTPFKELAIALPQKRPLIHIDKLVITHPELAYPMDVVVTEPSLNSFDLSGDVDAQINVSTHQVAGRFAINDQLLKTLMPTPGMSLDTDNAFIFDGVSVDLKTTVDAQLTQQVKDCPIQITAHGRVNSFYQLNEQQGTVDAKQLKTHLALNKGCLALIKNQQQRDFIAAQLPLAWQLEIKDEVKIDKAQFVAPSIVLKAQQSTTQLSLDNLMFDIDEPIKSAQVALKLHALSPDIEHIALTATLNNLRLKGTYQLKLAQLPAFVSASANKLVSEGEFDVANILELSHNIKLTNESSVDKLAFDKYKANDFKASLTAKIDSEQKITVNLNSQLSSLIYEQYQLAGIENKTSASSNLAVGELFVDIDSDTKLREFNSDNLNLTDIRISSKGLQSRALKASHHVFIEDVELLVNHHVSAVAHPFEIIIPKQAATKLNPILHQFQPLATLTEGRISGVIRGDVNLQHADFTLHAEQVSSLYNDYLAKHFDTKVIGSYDSGLLNVTPTKLSLNELRAGVVVNHITGNWQVDDSIIELAQINGNVLGGKFSLDNYRLSDDSQQSLITFNNLDASQLIALDDKSGITLTGRVSGRLPVYFEKQGIAVKGGELHSEGAGKLLIEDNDAFDAVKAQQQELDPVLSLLENLNIQSLNSSVSLKPDGWLHLGVNLKGYNNEHKQQVNFNYNHEENIFTLLRALRLSDEITQKVEQEYSKKGTRND